MSDRAYGIFFGVVLFIFILVVNNADKEADAQRSENTLLKRQLNEAQVNARNIEDLVDDMEQNQEFIDDYVVALRSEVSALKQTLED